MLINGCFGHGHDGCKYYRFPQTNIEFWQSKITRNHQRDEEAVKQLSEKGWSVITIWECALKNKENRETTLANLNLRLRQIQTPYKEYDFDIAPNLAAEDESEYSSTYK